MASLFQAINIFILSIVMVCQFFTSLSHRHARNGSHREPTKIACFPATPSSTFKPSMSRLININKHIGDSTLAHLTTSPYGKMVHIEIFVMKFMENNEQHIQTN